MPVLTSVSFTGSPAHTESPTHSHWHVFRRSGVAPRTFGTHDGFGECRSYESGGIGRTRRESMARGNGSTVVVKDQPAKTLKDKTAAAERVAQTQAPHRHVGPYGVSFDGTEADGTTPVKGLTFE